MDPARLQNIFFMFSDLVTQEVQTKTLVLSSSINSVGVEDSSNIEVQVVFLLVLIVLSSCFSMTETALMSINKIKLRNMVDDNVKNALLIQQVLDDPDNLLSAILIGNNLVNIGASSLATSLAIAQWGQNGVAYATGILTLIVLIFGEITPKTYANKNAEKIGVIVVKPVKFCMIIFRPLIIVLNMVSGVFLRILGVKREEKGPTITESELITMVNVGHEEGVLEVDAHEMINNVFDFANRDAEDIMIPRTDIVALNINSTYDEVFEIFKQETFSRLPVYEGNIDNIVGIISLKDLLFIKNYDDFILKKYMRKPFFTYESKGLKSLFSEMRAKRIPVCIILDEYGGTSGMVTLEDILEEIVGDISDEYDEHHDEITELTENEFIVEGATKIDDVNEMLGSEFCSEDFDSIGGFVIESIGRFPEKEEMIEIQGYKITVEAVEKNRIELLRIIRN